MHTIVHAMSDNISLEINIVKKQSLKTRSFYAIQKNHAKPQQFHRTILENWFPRQDAMHS